MRIEQIKCIDENCAYTKAVLKAKEYGFDQEWVGEGLDLTDEICDNLKYYDIFMNNTLYIYYW